MKVTELIENVSDWATAELKTPVEVIDTDEFPKPDEIFSETRKWVRIEDVVALVVDMKGSTALDYNKHPHTSARTYEAITGGSARIVGDFDPAFVDIQGDGLFALFHGERRYERALCAGVTLKTFSEKHLVPAIENANSDRFPKTGLKIGIASSTLVVKKVGIRGTNEYVWPGRAVNWAAKCAQKADAHELIVIERVWNKFKDNDYVAFSCGCGVAPSGGTVKPLWSSIPVETLGQPPVACMVLRSGWCANCGDEFCSAILDGKKSRDGVPDWLLA